jgi:hypothetical protein
VVPEKEEIPDQAETQAEEVGGQKLSKRKTWAELLARVFNIDMKACTECGGDFKIVAAIMEQLLIN